MKLLGVIFHQGISGTVRASLHGQLAVFFLLHYGENEMNAYYRIGFFDNVICTVLLIALCRFSNAL